MAEQPLLYAVSVRWARPCDPKVHLLHRDREGPPAEGFPNYALLHRDPTRGVPKTVPIAPEPDWPAAGGITKHDLLYQNRITALRWASLRSFHTTASAAALSIDPKIGG